MSKNLAVMRASQRVWKYAIEEGPFVLRPPGRGRVLRVGVDPKGAPSIWLLIETDAEPVERRHRSYETGEQISNSQGLLYCGS